MINFLKSLFAKIIPGINIDPKKENQPISNPPYSPAANSLVDVFAPCDGVLVDQKDIPDPAFASIVSGIGVGFKPKETCDLCAFMSGEHLCNPNFSNQNYIKNSISDVTVFLFVGIENGETPPLDEDYASLVSSRNVVVGDTIGRVDMDYLQKKCKSAVCPIIVKPSSLKDREFVLRATLGTEIKKGDLLFSVVAKELW
ncbi:PTS glucose transporter subunit IIA [Candidatus Mycoplasma haematohominis]|uniref:PTS system glucoside-specific EIICBA component n=1 Tax=Candidatus Mycoplasma haematohominis TaxID=1494318 RepID=A0A478FQ47_9MOLU|nr:PTS glucose transporter subunit IIA [Candidatus Mycoplasma haemohominis]GCE63207.1 PTS system glucoside-specific EIICBA component [Candidatus Mycoplasma haemohominis]